MSRSLNTKASSIGKSNEKRNERYNKKHVNKPRGQSGTHRLKNLKTTPVVADVEIETKKQSVGIKSIFGKIISRFK